MAEKYIVTSALPYINGVKHLGNLIGSLLPADIYARFRRMQGHDVLAICGTDEHGTPAEIAAIEEGMPIEQYAEKYYAKQKKIYEDFGLSFDHFGRTSSRENHQMTQHIFLRLYERGLINERTTKQLYSLDDERYLPDRFVIGTCPRCGYERARGDQCEECTRLLDPTELLDPRSAISGSSRLEMRESKHLFIDLPKMAPRLEEWLKDKDHWPRTTMSIARKWLNEGLRERCITRDLAWGIPVPLEGYEGKVFYVWFDAPIGYVGISMEWAKVCGEPDRWQEYWKDPQARLVQFMAKDNIPFHTITWPAVMMGADDGFVLADMIKGLQWLNYEGGKFSTSRNRGVFTDDALNLFPPDYWRYYLTKIAPEKGDTDFRWAGFQEAVNRDLADALGNLLHRTLALINKHFGGLVPDGPAESEAALAARDAHRKITDYLDGCRFSLALRTMRDYWQFCNQFFDRKAPWQAVREDRDAAAAILADTAHLIRAAAVVAAPFLPFTAETIYRNLGLSANVHEDDWDNAVNWGALAGRKVAEKPEILFRKIEDSQIAELAERYAGGE